MKTYLILPFLLIALNCHIAFSQKSGKIEMPKYPKYVDVVNQFFTRYTTLGNDQEILLSFAKKPDGWHAVLSNYQNKKIEKDELYWSRKNGEYIEINFPNYVQAEIDPNYENMLNNERAISSTELVPYWGYEGWEMDVINEFAAKKNLSDSLLNSVARAYSSKARTYTDYNEFGNPEGLKKLPKGQNALSPEILANYLENQHKGIECYYKLYKQNPKFETFVADIFNVYSNEVMNGFLTLRYFQNEETAKKELKKGLYSPFYIEMAKNYLNSCDSNAILFTNGDMDTYPLLYVQEMENFRKDVLVVNLSLLNLGRYICHLANFKAGAKPLKVSVDLEIYKSEAKDIFFVIPDTITPLSVKEVVNIIMSKDEKLKYKLTDNQFYDVIPTQDIYFIIDRNKINNEYKEEMFQVDTSFNIHLTKNYLDVSDLCVIDIIASNNFDRPVYFASTVGRNSYFKFNGYMSLEGMAYKITPLKFEIIDLYEPERVYSDILYYKLINKLQFNTQNYNNIGLSQKRMISNYKNLFSRLATALTNENKSDKALQILDICLKYFPNNLIKLDYYSYPLIICYFKLNKAEKAKELVKICLNNCSEVLNYNLKFKGNKDADEKINIQVASLNELLKIATEYIPDDQVTKEISKKTEEFGYLLND